VVIAPYVLALCVSLALSVGFGILTWRRRPEPGTTALTVLLAAVSVWTGAFLFGMLSPDRGIRMLLERIMWTAMLVTPVAWLVFSIQYTGYDDSIAPRQIASLSVPLAIAGVLVWTNPAHEIIWSDVQFHSLDGLVLVSQSYNAMFWVQLGYAYTLMLAGVVLLLRLVLTSDHLFADQAFALLAGGLIATSAHFATVFKLSPFPGLNLTPYSFVLAGIAFGYALFYSELLERIPATRRIGRNAIVQNMRDGVVVLDDDDHVIDVNPIAERLFDADGGDVIGEHVDALFGDADYELPGNGETAVCTVKAHRKYEMRGSVLEDQHDRPVGRVLVVRDITSRSNRRQQLQVLNRVLRHNFRNDMNVIDVCATQLSDRLDDENEQLADRIRMTARDLAETGTKAREIERIMSRRDTEPQPIDLPSLVTRQLDTIRHEYPAVSVAVDMPEELEIRSTGILESVLQNVLENAVVHNDSADPEVRVDVNLHENDPDKIEIRVADNGPGIPEQERDVLVKGTESPLEHGSGLGLWLVNWGVTMLGGEVEFEDRAERSSAGNRPEAGDREGRSPSGSRTQSDDRAEQSSTGSRTQSDDTDSHGSTVCITIPRRQRLVEDPTHPAGEFYIDAD